MPLQDPRGSRLATRFYRLLLRAYPREFRSRFGPQMVDDFRDLYRDRSRRRGWSGIATAWSIVLRDWFKSVPAARRGRAPAPTDASGGGTPGPGPKPSRGSRFADLTGDLRFAARSLVRRPGLTVTVVLTLALSIGANTLIFTAVDGVILSPLPFDDADRLVSLRDIRMDNGAGGQASYPNFADWQALSTSYDRVGAVAENAVNLTGGAEPVRVEVALASWELFGTLGIQPILGRAFGPDEDRPGAAPVAVMSHSLWTDAFGRSEEVLERAVLVNGAPVEVVGVLPPGVQFPDEETQLWLPLRPNIGGWIDRREVHAMNVVGLLREDRTIEQARQELVTIAASLRDEYPDTMANRTTDVAYLHDLWIGDAKARIWIFMAAVVGVLLIACANLASLVLARGSARREELGVRAALGASRSRIARGLFIESLLLASLGGVAGLAVAKLGLGALRPHILDMVPLAYQIELDGRVIAFAAGITLASALLFGLLPAISAGRTNPDITLGGRGGTTSLGDRRGMRARRILSIGQLGGSVVLLIVSGLLLKSFWMLSRVDPGFDPENMTSMTVSLVGSELDTTEEVVAFYRSLPGRLEALAGVRSVSAVNHLPISGGDSGGTLTIEGQAFAPGTAPAASFRRTLPGYFRTSGIPIVEGREFTAEDSGEPMITIINESMARQYFPDGDAVGSRIKVGPPDNEPWLTIVGVVGDVRNVGLDVEPRLATYEPHIQRPWSTMNLVVRTEGSAVDVVPAIRAEIRAAGGEIPVFGESTLTDRISQSLSRERFGLILIGAFGLIALVIALVGVLGVMAYTVSLRTSEIGLRMALGSTPGGVARSILGQGASMVGIGIAAGLIIAAGATRVTASFLYQVQPMDWTVFLVVPLSLTAISLVACYMPARRATRVDPILALRSRD